MSVTVITASYNKSKYVLDAIKSVLNQTYQDWNYIIIENSTDNITRETIKNYLSSNQLQNDSRINYIERDYSLQERQQYYIPALIYNEYKEYANNNDYLFELSDDDYIMPNCFEKMANYLNDNPEVNVVYASLEAVSKKGNEFIPWNYLPAIEILPKGTNCVCRYDSGQIMFRKSCLEKLEKPYTNISKNNCFCSDGVFLTKLCKEFEFYPINKTLIIHRHTELSMNDPSPN